VQSSTNFVKWARAGSAGDDGLARDVDLSGWWWSSKGRSISSTIITGVGWISHWFNKNKIINNWLSAHNIRSDMKSNTVWSISSTIITGVGWISHWFNKNKLINNWLSAHNIRSDMKSNTIWSIFSTIITGVGWISYWFTNIYKLINNWLPAHIRSNMKRSTDWYEYLRYFNSQRNQ